MGGFGKFYKTFLGVLLLSALACGSAVDSNALGTTEGENSGVADSGSTVLGTYEMSFNPSTGQQTMMRTSPTGMVADRLLMSADNAASLASTLGPTDFTLSAWAANDWDDGNNALNFENSAITNTNTDSKHYHYSNLMAHFTVFNPTSLNMNTTPASVTCGNSGCYLAYGDVPYNTGASRDFFLFDPAGTAFKVGIQFEATLTQTAPTAYVSSVNFNWWPKNSFTDDDVTITGLGFGTKAKVSIGGTNLPILDNTDTTITLDTAALPDISGTLEVDNGTAKINGPYIKTRTLFGFSYASNSTEGPYNGKIYMLVWDGTATVGASGCPPTSNLGNYDIENASPFPFPAGTGNILGTAYPWNFVDVAGTKLKIYIAYDKTGNGLGVNSGSDQDYYYYATNQTITYHGANFAASLGAGTGSSWSYINNSNTACP